jgi:hypothetical protein
MKPKRPRDTNQRAKMIVDLTTRVTTEPDPNAGKDAKAVVRGRSGGIKGGKARADALSARRRKQMATKAAASRWTALSREIRRSRV